MPSRIGIIVKYILFEIFLSFCKKCADMQKKNCDLILALDLPDKGNQIAAFAAAVLGVVIALVISRARHSSDPTPTRIVNVIDD